MRHPASLLAPLAAVLALAALAPALRAEVRAVLHPTQGWSVQRVTVDGRPWTPVPPHAFGPDVLNPGGDVAGDGVASTGIRPTVGLPEAVYSMATPRGSEIAFVRHDGAEWGGPRLVTADALAEDLHPLIEWDDHGRSILTWKKIGGEDTVHVAGLSIDGRLWGQRLLEGPGWRNVAMRTDGESIYVAHVHQLGGRLRFQLVGFPFPNGGPALPFPDDSLMVAPVADEPVGPDEAVPLSTGGHAPMAPRPDAMPATLAATTLEMHRDGVKVWADWVTLDDTVRWVAFRDGQVIGRGEEPFNGPNQVDGARDRVRRLVADL